MLRVLIIEDSPVNMLLTATILERAGHIPMQAASASEGIALAQRERPDVILMDLQLPDMDGLAATRLLKADPQVGRVPVMAFTAAADAEDAQAAREAGCDGFLTKPMRYKEFIAAVEAAASRVGAKGR